MLTQLHVDLPKDLHATLKAEAALNQQTLREYTIAILRDHLNGNIRSNQASSLPSKS
ncbi:hypothetical protein H6F43_04230 [Leptolyngbya sp. FACHB-36]|uniref:hypothetical protein n=1 Tax=Leptolyngbya sp. FACHB-36 TaxID=2692808 RepID=UPI001680307F|nr:hypothetical protein [Leptolyngbya sp. FACHB-36]MBD2019391.1 hypothetical protein [Leptolyngbya sp. FACHB-36]